MAFESTLKKNIETHLKLYPESTLKDIYKSFFQDEFGPGHLLESPEKARSYFDQELNSMKSRGRHCAEPCGTGLNFYRLPLDLVLDDLVKADDYFSVFLASAKEFILPDIKVWEKKWIIILEILKQKSGEIKNFERDSADILEALEQGNYVMHHSSQYRKFYNPHYRIIGRRWISLFNLEKL